MPALEETLLTAVHFVNATRESMGVMVVQASASTAWTTQQAPNVSPVFQVILVTQCRAFPASHVRVHWWIEVSVHPVSWTMTAYQLVLHVKRATQEEIANSVSMATLVTPW